MSSKKQLRSEIAWLRGARESALARERAIERLYKESRDREDMYKRIIEQREQVIAALQVDIPAHQRIGLSPHNNPGGAYGPGEDILTPDERLEIVSKMEPNDGR